MDRFEYVFSLIGLLLGLSLVEVLSGLVKARKARSKTRIGSLTPMLGILVILHVTSFWGITWSLRELLPPTIWQTLGAGVLLSGAYYLAASAVFPEHPEQFEDLDSYYWQHKREVLGIILACSLVVQIFAFGLGRALTPLILAINLPLFAGMAIACFARSRPVNLVVLGSMIAVLAVNFMVP
jgi:hypothetical protein